MQSVMELADKYLVLLPHLDERSRRLVLASDAQSFGRGGLQLVAKASGVSRMTLNAGIRDLERGLSAGNEQYSGIRRPGGGRKKETHKNQKLAGVIEDIVRPHTLGDPMRPLQWTSKSLRKIADAANELGYNVSHELVKRILKGLGYSLQSNRKTDEGGTHEDRDAQFEQINTITQAFFADNQPVISVDCKKKEVLGNLKNGRQEWCPGGEPREVKVYDFIDPKLGKAVPYGVYDVANNEGWVSVGISYDTASFVVAGIRSWWEEMGKLQFLGATKIYITADSGGSNSSRSKLWKKELQLFANELNMDVHVSHFPPGTSKWNKIEHKLFSFISQNWKAKPLTSLQIVINLIASTTTKSGLKVKSKIDTTILEKDTVLNSK